MAMQEIHNSPEKDNLFAAKAGMYVAPGKITMTVTGSRGALVTSSGTIATGVSDAYAVLAVDVETENTEVPVYLTGEFNATVLSDKTGVEIADGAIIQNRIFVRKNIEA